MFLPHEFYPSTLHDLGSDALCLSNETLEAGQDLARLLLEWAGHRDVQFEGELKDVGILGLHADGVQYTSTVRAGGSRSIVVGSMNIVSGSEAVSHRRQPLFVIRKARLCQCGCQGFHTIQELMEVLAWSMRCLVSGEAPACRHDGNDFSPAELVKRMPAGTRLPKAALLQVRGDWEWLEQCFRLRSVSSDAFCWMCQATQRTPGPLHYHDFREDAAHRGTLISHESYFQSCVQERCQPSHLFRCPGTMLDHLTVDSMHAGDLGTFQDAIGSLFWLEINHKSWHSSKRRGLEQLNISLNNFYAAHQNQNLTKITPLTQGQILASKPGYPFLKAKAAQTRHLAQFCLTLARRHQAGDATRSPFRFRANHRLAAHSERHGALLVALFDGLLKYTKSCSASPFQIADCRAAMYQYLQSLKELHDLWRLGAPEALVNKLPFHIRPKAHVCQHLVHEKIEAFGSPSMFWCYRDSVFLFTSCLLWTPHGGSRSLCSGTQWGGIRPSSFYKSKITPWACHHGTKN